MSSFVEKKRSASRAVRWMLPLFLLAMAAVSLPRARAQAPANDRFTNAAPIFGMDGTFPGSNIGATRETNEPIHYVGSPFSSNSVWFQWTAPADGVVTFDTIGTYAMSFTNFFFSLDTVLAAYTTNSANPVTNLTTNLRRLASDDDSGGTYPSTDSLIRFPVQAGVTYYIAIDGYRTGRNGIGTFNSVGSYLLNWTMGIKPPVFVPPDLIQFSSPTYSVQENQLFANITLWYGGDSSMGANGTVSVDFFTTNGTAIDGTNYLGTMGTNLTIVFDPGIRVTNVIIPIIDDFVLNADRTVFLGLTNPTNAYLTNAYVTNVFIIGVSGTNFIYQTNISASPYPPNALLTIVDDERQFQNTGGSVGFSSSFYVGTENETLPAPFGLPIPTVGGRSPVIRDVNLPGVVLAGDRSPLGVVVKVNRSTPASGRILVDYRTEVSTATNVIIGPVVTASFAGKAGVDFFPTSGTLVFDDYQMSAEIVLPVYSNSVSNNASAIFDVVLSNARPAPEEFAQSSLPPFPSLGFQSRATVQVLEVNERFRTFSFERMLYRYDEYDPVQNEIPSTNGVRTVSVDVILPGGGGGNVTVRMLQNTAARYAHDLQAGSDYATLTPNTFFNTPYTDGTAPIRTESDFTDFQDTTLTFPGTGPQQNRQTATFTITNDNTVEFNEDVRFELIAPNNFFEGPAFESAATILFDDPPAGAADREWNPEGLYYTQPAFNNAPGANNAVSAVAVQPDNRTIIVGDFTAYNSTPRNHIARINVDGSIDVSFNHVTGADDFIATVAICTNSPNPNNIGKIMIGGGFTSFDGADRSGIARLNADGSLDTTFRPGNGTDGAVRSIVLQSDGKILVGGDFQHFNDMPVNRIMRLNEDGTLDTTFNASANGTIWSVVVRDAAVPFTVSRRSGSATSLDRNLVDTGATSGSIAIDYDFGGGDDNIRIYYDGALLLDLTTNGTNRIVVPYGPGIGTSIEIVMDEVFAGGNWFYTATITPDAPPRSIYVAGEFATVNGQSLRGVARLHEDGSVDSSFNPGVSVNGPVYAMAVQPNNRVLLGGAFTKFQDSARKSLVRLLSDGKQDVDFHTGVGADNAVYAITLRSDGRIYLGGIFQSYNGTRRMGLARLFGNGALDTSFLDTAYNQFAGLVKTFSFDSPRYVNSIALQADGGVMIGGSFDKVGGNPSYNDPAYAGVNLYAPFTRAQKVTRQNVARLLGGYTDGPGNIEFDPAAGSFSVVENIGTLSAPLRRVDGRLGTATAFADITGNTATVPGDVFGTSSSAFWQEWWLIAPRSVGFPGFRYFTVPIVDDNLREGNETFNLSAANVGGSLTLGNSFFFGFFGSGGEIIPLGAAVGYNASAPVTIVDNEFDSGEINFAIDNFVVEEGSGQAFVTIIRTNGSVGSVSVQLFVTNGSAVAGQDYIAPLGPQPIFFGQGVTSNRFAITLINNPEVELDETIRLVLANPTGGATLPGGLPSSTATATVTIVDDDFLPGRINFTPTNYVANETATQAVVTVTRTGGNLNLLTVQYTTSDGTAMAPGDYGARSNTLVWNSGDSSPRTIIIPLVTDGLVEGPETVELRLFNPSIAGALGDRTNATLTIEDGDNYGTFSFSQALYTVGEEDASPVFTVIRRGGLAGTVTVSFATSPLTATNNFDYIDTNGVLTFLPGELSKTFSVPVLDDLDIDGDKTFSIMLSSPTPAGATLGAISTTFVTLVDNESVSTPAGSLDTAFSDASAPNGAVYALALQTNGAVIMAGDFTEVGSVPRNHIARLLGDGTLDQTFDIGPGADGSIRALALQSDGRILVGGLFSTINGTNRNGLARLSIDGKVDTSFDPGSGADNPVLAITVQSDDKVLAGGSFSHFRSFSSPGLVRLNTNGTLDTTFSVGAGFNGTVYAVEIQNDGKILVGGNFVSFNGIARTNFVRLNPNGSLDPTFNPAFSIDSPVRVILAEADGRILIGGSFTTVNGVTRRFLARLEQDGALDAGFLAGPNDGADNVVNAIKQQVDGRLIVAGDFRSFNGVTRHAITRLNDSDGSIDPTINFGSGANAFVAALAIQPDRKILLGGGFTEYDGRPRKFIARIYGGSISGAGTLDFDIPPGSPYFGTFSVSETETNAAITVRRRGGTTGTVSVHYATTNGTAIANRDYLSVEGDIVFPQGETFRIINVPILQNNVPDGDRSLDLGLSNFVGATPGPQPNATLFIIDDESVIRFTASEYSIIESPVSGNATIGVFRGGGTNRTVSVDFSTTPGTATAGLDYVAAGGTVVFQPGEIFKNVNVPIIDDTLAEGNETLSLHLLNAGAGATITGADATLVIVDNDFAPGQFRFLTNNFGVEETNGSVSVAIQRINGSSGSASVRLRTSDGTASNILDYTATDRVVNFSDGETIKFVSIPILDDAIFESDEYFNLTLSQPSPGTSIINPDAVVTIIDDEFGPSYVGFASATFLGNEISGLATISVVRTNTRRGIVSVNYSTSDGTATSADYVPTNGTLVFADGEILKTFTVALINDGITEPAETVNLTLGSLSSGFLSLSNATLNIADNSLPLQFSSPSYTVSENAGSATITVTRVGPATSAVTVDFATVAGGTATPGLDYTPVSGTLSWAAGDSSTKTFTVPIIDNNVVNAARTVSLLLSNPSGTASATLTITDNESQSPVAGPVDPTFNGNFGANATVFSVMYDAQERLYVGGDFTQLYGLHINRVARLAANGAVDLSFDPGAGANGPIYGMARGTNSIYVGGAFTMIDGIPRGGVARLLLNGTVDPAFNSGIGANAPVFAVASLPNDQVLIGGQFTSVSGIGANRIARLNANGSLDPAFATGTGPNAAVRAVAVQTNGQVIIAGDFTAVSGFVFTRIARLNSDGVVDTSFQTSLGADGSVYGVAIQFDGKIVIVGDFQTVNGSPRNGIARLNSDGSVDFSFNPGSGANGRVRTVVFQPDGRIVVGGDFTTMAGLAANRIARLNVDGSVDSGFEVGSGADAPVYSLALANVTSTFVIPRQASGTDLEDRFTVDTGANSGVITIDYDFISVPDNIRVYYDGVRIFDLTTNGIGQLVIPYGPGASTFVTVVMNEGTGLIGTAWLYTLTITTGARLDNRIAMGGDFTKFDGEPKGRIAVLNSTGSLYPLFDPGAISARAVLALGLYTNASQPSLNGKWMVGGDFTAIVGVNDQNRVARLNLDGTLDRGFNMGRGADNTVRALALQPDGKVIIGGLFTSYDFSGRAYLARINPNGLLDNTFNSANGGLNINNPVHALTLQPDGKVIIGGSFTEVYGTSRNSIARMHPNGTVDVTFNPGTGASGPINAVALQSDGKVLIGGDFILVNGVSRFRVARLNADGSVDTTFNPGAGTDGAVNAIAIADDGRILIGGNFSSVDGVAASRIARLNSDGSLDASFNAGTGANDYISSIAVQPDGNIVVGGNFTVFNGQVRNRLVRLLSDGALDPSINFGTGANDFIAAIGLQNYDGKIVVGGGFTRFDELPRVAIARLFGGTNSGAGTFQFSAATYHVSESAGTVTLTVERTGGTLGAASVDFTTANGTATSPANYTAVSGTLNFAPAESVKFITVSISDNAVTNVDRTFTVSLFAPTGGATLGTPSAAEVVIDDNDSVVSFSSAIYSVNENGGSARITVNRSGGASDLVSVEYHVGTNGTATAGVDYIATSGILTFAPGVRSQTFEVPVIDDAIAEFNETVPLSLLNVTGPAALGLSGATLTIVENDFNPGVITFGTNTYFVSEDAGSIAVEVLRTNGHSGVVTVNFQTLNTGTATPNIDYASTNGTITFIDGQTNAFVILRVIDDAVSEGNETVPVRLSLPSGGATLGLADADVTIVDNDAPGTFVFSAAVYTINESNAVATITVIRTNGNIGPVNVTVQSSGGTATATVDYAPVSTVLAFADRQTVRTFTVPIIQDTIVEGTETVQLLLSNPSPGTFINQPNPATLQIVDDEVSVGFSAATYTVTESLTNVTITVIRTGDTNNGFFVTVNTSDGTATANADYGPRTTTLFFAPGVTNQTFTVAVFEDTLAEGDEFLNLTLSSASSGVALGPIATARLDILDNDTGFNFSSATYATNEATVDLIITVIRSGFIGATGSVEYATFDGTAITNLDYLQATGRLAFAVGQTSAIFAVRILDDVLVEGNETINLVLANPLGGSLGPQSTAVITIIDNDTTLGFARTGYVVNEKVTNAVITVVRNGAGTQPAQVSFRTLNGTAVAGQDYGAVSNVLIWGAGDISPKTFLVPIFDDAISEGAETVLLQLVTPIGATIDPASGSAVLTIVDNAGLIAFASAGYSVVEGSGNALINLVRTGGSNGTVNVQWNVTGGSATPGQDYFGAAGTVVFASGETTKPIIFPIGDDATPEGIETVNLTISSVDGGAIIGSPRNAVLSIIDNDAGIIVGAGSALIFESFTPTNNIIEPGETVTLLFALRNAGIVNADNVSAFLVYSNGISHTSVQVQNYGALLAGGASASRPFTFTASGTNGSRITATLLITNNGLFLGPVSFDFVLGRQNIPFQNANQITINDNTNATPYPATLVVSGVSGPVNHLTVTLHGLSHNFPDDIDILLVGPNGAAVMLMSDAGGGLANALNNVTITFDDAAANVIPDFSRITNGTYRSANHFTQVDPMPPFANNTLWNNTSLATFDGINPNGVWSLYVVDDASGQNGLIANGWSLNIATADPVIPGADISVTITDSPDPVIAGGTVTYQISVINHGPSAASSVMVTSALPPQANFVSVSGPGSYTLNGNVLVGSLGTIPIGGNVLVTVTMTAPNSATLLTFDSTVSAGQTDLNTDNNHVSIKTSVSDIPSTPFLFASRKDGQLVLSWQGTGTNIVLQSSALMGGGWSSVPEPRVVSNGISTVTLPLNGNTKFFRLGRVE
jgi:uncharacterized delta-60 repeat protein/uncharacterized repeat protein (TIGR01451 family)